MQAADCLCEGPVGLEADELVLPAADRETRLSSIRKKMDVTSTTRYIGAVLDGIEGWPTRHGRHRRQYKKSDCAVIGMHARAVVRVECENDCGVSDFVRDGLDQIRASRPVDPFRDDIVRRYRSAVGELPLHYRGVKHCSGPQQLAPAHAGQIPATNATADAALALREDKKLAWPALDHAQAT
jgi:hypothetical protein